MAKKYILLTDIMMHVRPHRQTGSFAKAEDKGRMYSPLPRDYHKKDVDASKHTFRFSFQLPPDLMEQVKNGEVGILMPKGGLNVYAGPDTHALVEKTQRKERREDIHKKWGFRNWLNRKRGV